MKTPVGPRVRLALTVNGAAVDVDVETGELLLDVLRERLGLTGAKRSCDSQVCGACTVLLDGRPVSSCTLLAWEARGRDVQTIEGLGRAGRRHPGEGALHPAPAGPEESRPESAAFFTQEIAYHRALDWRFAAGSFNAPGPATSSAG